MAGSTRRIASSPLFGLLAGGRRVRFRLADENGDLQTQWTGWLDDIPQTERVSGLDTINLRALGVLSRLERPVTIAHQTAITVEDAGALLFDPDGSIGSADANVDGADYRASDIEGKRVMARWWVDDLPRLQALRELEQTEAGFALEEKDGFVGLQPFDRRSAASSRIVRATLTDSATPGVGDIPVLQGGFIPDEALRDSGEPDHHARYGSSVPERLRRFGAPPALSFPGNTEVPVTIRYPGPNCAPQPRRRRFLDHAGCRNGLRGSIRRGRGLCQRGKRGDHYLHQHRRAGHLPVIRGSGRSGCRA